MQKSHSQGNVFTFKLSEIFTVQGWKKLFRRFGFATITLTIAIVGGTFGTVYFGSQTVASVNTNNQYLALVEETLETDSQDPFVLRNNLRQVLNSAFAGYEEVNTVNLLLGDVNHSSFSVSRSEYDAATPIILEYLKKTGDLKNGVYAFKALNASLKIPLSVTPMGQTSLTGKMSQAYGDDVADFVASGAMVIAASSHATSLFNELAGAFK